VDYAYNIRNWLTGINNTGNLQESGEPKDLFAFRISYNQVENYPNMGYTGTPLFNGNISETYWRSNSDDLLRKYGYRYDNLNRLVDAVYMKPGVGSVVTHAYDESMGYDKNGNIQYMFRNGYLDDDSGASYEIDKLWYTYEDGSNKLIDVKDESNSIDGFKDGQNPDPGKLEYGYDSFGNMTEDWNKGIEGISYNHLNLPTKINFHLYNGGEKFITYLYNALGKKVRKHVIDNSGQGSNQDNTTDYLDGFHYMDENLEFFPTAEGYVSVIKDNFRYVYNYTDHLGNIRLGYSKDPGSGQLKILEENHYYPFGMKHSYNSSIKEWGGSRETGDFHAILVPVERGKYQYKYKGQEYQDELGLGWYDYQARNYDPAIGRWMNIDPLAENSRRWTPYNYAYNNPMYFIDPDGRDAVTLTGDAAREFIGQVQRAMGAGKRR
jgi:RHS repeat-associated protein